MAEGIAEDLRDEGFSEVRVMRETRLGADEDDDEDEWAVYVVEETISDESGAVERGLRDRFEKLAGDNDGWYDPEPEPRD